MHENPTPDIQLNSRLILEHEEEFAAQLSGHVMDRPRLNIWMILIPIIFVYFFYDLNKYKNGRKMFVSHYLVGKKRALDEAVDAVRMRREPDIRTLAQLSDIPDEAREKQADVLAVLVEHYSILLKSDGEDYSSLVQTAYGNLTNYLLFLNRLNQVEKEAITALEPQMSESGDEISDVVSRMERMSEKLRREIAESIFQ